MVNFGLNSASILGIFLAVAGAGLYFLRTVRPELSRDHDIFFAAIGLLCGFILLFQGWRLDPILQFGQVLLTGSAIFFAVESIRMRSVATEQAKRSAPIVDDERPVSRVYRAELDELEPVDERPVTRRLRGRQDPRNSSRDSYEGEVRRRPSNSRGSSERSSERNSERYDTERNSERYDTEEPPRKRRSRPTTRPASEQPDEWGDNWGEATTWEEQPKQRRRSGSKPSRPVGDEPEISSSRPRRSRPPEDFGSKSESDVEATPTDYVDYKPVDYPDEDSDNIDNYS